MDPSEVRRVAGSFRRIGGWFSADAAAFFGLIDEAQKQEGLTGDLFEIGVHHGRSAVLLARMALPSERLRVCDVFARQDLNASESGSGDRRRLEQNLARVAPSADYEILERSSLELSRETIGTGYRFFHIDGGHSKEEALSDLDLAADVLMPGGVIAVDDPFRHEWPGVTEALGDFCRASSYRPFAMGFNKIILADPEARTVYLTALNSKEWEYFNRLVYTRKDTPVFGSPTAVYFIPSYRRLPPSADHTVALARWGASHVSTIFGRRS